MFTFVLEKVLVNTRLFRLINCFGLLEIMIKMGTVYKLKIDDQGNMAKVISIIRKFDSSLSMGEIKKRITENDYVVQYDLTHWDITEDMEGIDRIASFENLVSMLQNVGAEVSVYNEDKLLMPELFHNKMVTLREIRDEVEKDMDRESTE